MRGRVLLIDDDPRICSQVHRQLVNAGLEVESFLDPESGLAQLRNEPFDVLVTDLRMPGIDGLEVVRRSRVIRPECEVVVVTGHASAATARDALKRGAVDYIHKPLSVEQQLLPIIREILATEPTATETASREGPPSDEPRPSAADVGEPIGSSPAMRDALERARKVAMSSAPVLLLGESGVGKEVFAHWIHRTSSRASESFMRINCAALPESLLESELFGHVRGAFTGAAQDRKGIFHAAHGGSLFLDEIGEMSPAVQPKLLRVLQEGEVQRVGDVGRITRVDVRLITATNRDLAEAVKRGRFREDLFYRLAVVPIVIPPLRDHLEDLLELIDHLAGRLGVRVHFSDEAFDVMTRYSWPGNVRELSNAIEHAVVLGDSEKIELRDLPAAIQESARMGRLPVVEEDGDTLESIEQRTILQSLERTGFNRTEAARLLGVTRRTLGYRIRKYGLDDAIEALQEVVDSGGASSQSQAESGRRPKMRRVPPRGASVRDASGGGI